MRLAVAMRTADRKTRNYLRPTLIDFQRAGADLTQVHLCATHPNTAWLEQAIDGLPRPIVHVPDRPLRANENGLAQVEHALSDGADMILLLEDDLLFCADVLGSISRWLDRWARPSRHVYRCFGFTHPPKDKPAAYDWPLAGLRGSQAILLWQDEAQHFLSWGRAHLTTWVPLSPWGRKYPLVTDPHVAFDKFVATWALLRWPDVPGVMSYPYFVKHVGDQSLLHRFGVRNDGPFAGTTWRYDEVSA